MTNINPCPCGRDSSDDNAVQESSVRLVIVKSGLGGRAYRVECDCGWSGPINLHAHDAIAVWNKRVSVDDWKTIDTAPKDRLILLAAEFDRPGDWRIKTGGWRADKQCWEVFGASWKPTMWKDLPDPPTSC